MKKLLSLIAAGALLCGTLSGCKDSGSNSSAGSQAAGTASSAEVDFAQTEADMFTDRDYEVGYDEGGSALIQLNGSTASSSSDAVRISGSTVTLIGEGTYILSGTLSDGMIVVNAGASDKLHLILNGVTVTSTSSAALYILEADKVFVTLAEGTANTLANGGSFTAIDENSIDGAVFSKQDLTLNGSGSLTVSSPAGHGIVCKDDLVITSGSYTVQSSSHGIDANDSVRISGADITIDAGKDGIHAENNDDTSLGFVYITSGGLKIEAEGDGISAGAYMQIEGGSFELVTGGGSVNAAKQTSDQWGGFMGGGPRGQQLPSSAGSEEDSTSIKGLKAAGSLLISDGTFTIDSADDAVHSNASITVNGGSFKIASGDDAFHADENLTVTAGTISITTCYEGLEALHVAVSGGEIDLVASDDGLNAAGGTDSSGFGGGRGGDRFGGGSASNGTIVISGGTVYIEASGDGIDANGSLTISGGAVTVCGPTQGDTATLDFDTTGTISGGIFIGTGGAGMAQTFSDSEQGVLSINVGNQSAGTTITLKDKDGSTILSHTPKLSFAVVILSSPELVSGETYTIAIGSTEGKFEAS